MHDTFYIHVLSNYTHRESPSPRNVLLCFPMFSLLFFPATSAVVSFYLSFLLWFCLRQCCFVWVLCVCECLQLCCCSCESVYLWYVFTYVRLCVCPCVFLVSLCSLFNINYNPFLRFPLFYTPLVQSSIVAAF